MMGRSTRKLVLTVHLASTLGWLGALGAFLALALVGLNSAEAQVARASYVAMSLIAWVVILPLSFASLATGLVQALGSQWGFRHYWVLAKLLLTTVAVAVLLLKMPAITLLGQAAQTVFSASELRGLRISVMVHAAGGMLILLGTTILAVYKPQGLIRYGEEPAPRWVKVFATAFTLLIVLVALMLFAGGHGPGAHMPSPRVGPYSSISAAHPAARSWRAPRAFVAHSSSHNPGRYRPTSPSSRAG